MLGGLSVEDHPVDVQAVGQVQDAEHEASCPDDLAEFRGARHEHLNGQFRRLVMKVGREPGPEQLGDQPGEVVAGLWLGRRVVQSGFDDVDCAFLHWP